jgi:nicotinamidase/pyrazinamidase
MPKNPIIASVDVDAQQCFTALCPNELPVPGGEEIVAELNAQARLATYRVGSKDAHPPDPVWRADASHPPLSPIRGKNVDVRWPLHGVVGTRGAALLPGLPHPSEYDFFVWKGVEPDMHPYGACYHDLAESQSTGAIEFLKTKSVENVIVGGLATEFCVKTTVMQLHRAGFVVHVNLAACRGLTSEGVQQALQEIQSAGIQCFESSKEIAQHVGAYA